MAALPFRVKAVYDYTSGHEDDLSFSNGQIITVTDVEDDDWYFGEYADNGGSQKQGLFPKNFVERYEPVTPPRPSRPARKEPEPELQSQTNKAESTPPTPVPVPSERVETVDAEAEQNIPEDDEEEDQEEDAEDPTPASTSTVTQARDETSNSQQLPARISSPPQIQKTETRASTQPTRSLPPPLSADKSPSSDTAEPPKSSSFKDRIAAFNKPAASPLAPPKPGQLQTSSFIKKPFVAPPPSRDAYVPIPRDTAPHKVFQREESTASVGSTQENERPIVTSSTTVDEPQEDQPKPTSLKERIALLQKQQLEQSARHAELAAKKAKPAKPPPRKKEEVAHGDDEVAESTGPTQAGLENGGDESMDTSQTLHGDANDTNQSVDEETEDNTSAIASQAPKISLIQPIPPAPQHNTLSEDEDEGEIRDTKRAAPENEENEVEEQEEEAEEEVDPEIKRRMEIRERMAKMSGGMGMAGMFGPPGGLPLNSPRRAKPVDSQNSNQEEDHRSSPPVRPVPVMALPGMALPPLSKVRTAEDESESQKEAPPSLLPPRIPGKPDSDAEDSEQETTLPSRPLPPLPPTNVLSSNDRDDSLYEDDVDSAPSLNRAAPPVPEHQDIQRSPSTSSHAPTKPFMRQPPPLPPAPPRTTTQFLSTGEDSDDESSTAQEVEPPQTNQNRRLPPRIPTNVIDGTSDTAPISPISSTHEPQVIKASTFPQSSSSTKEKRMSRPPPPVPSAAPPLPSSPPSMRSPPPPPPPTRDSNVAVTPGIEAEHEDSEEEVTEYEGDYDTDIAAGDSHKDALAAEQNSSTDDTLTGDEEAYHHSGLPSIGPPSGIPPIPSAYAPRGAPPPPPPREPPQNSRQSSDLPRSPPPPPPPTQSSGKTRQSADIPRSMPPPIPQRAAQQDGDYDPYNYNASPPMPPRQLQTTVSILRSDQQYSDQQEPTIITPISRAPPPQPPTTQASLPPPAAASNTRQSLDVARAGPARSSMDGRPSMDQHSGYMAHEIDVARSSNWWLQRKMPPPSIQNRADVAYEIEESTAIQQDGTELVLKHVYVLFMDYSQTILSARYSVSNPSALDFTQRYEPPPAPLRQDQLEDAHSKFGARIAEMANQKLNHIVGNGSPIAFIAELLHNFADAVPAIGGRAFGAVVYTNLANATVQQLDEIRTGDIITFRNAKLQGHKGPMKQKYNIDVGKPDHAAVVVDWDGTKKKVRAWEQGRESKKVKIESFKLGDLKSGEVKIWRVVGRDWVGWGSKS